MAVARVDLSLWVAAVVGILALCAPLSDAKITGVTGDVFLMGPGGVPLPDNVFNNAQDGEADASSPIVDSKLRIGIFEEKTNISPAADTLISGGVTLSKNKLYDSFFFFFHQQRPGQTSRSAKGTASFDNALVGCTSSNNEFNNGAKEIATTPTFGLDLTDFYPTTVFDARGLEAGDFATTGTSLSLDLTITQPGDYARCFTESCPAAGTCTCSAAPPTKPVCIAGPGTQCFPSVASLLSFSSSCSQITADSASYVVSAGCDGTNGCTLNADGSICFAKGSAPFQLAISGVAACGCQISVEDLNVLSCDDIPACETSSIPAGQDYAFASSTGKCACLEA